MNAVKEITPSVIVAVEDGEIVPVSAVIVLREDRVNESLSTAIFDAFVSLTESRVVASVNLSLTVIIGGDDDVSFWEPRKHRPCDMKEVTAIHSGDRG